MTLYSISDDDDNQYYIPDDDDDFDDDVYIADDDNDDFMDHLATQAQVPNSLWIRVGCSVVVLRV